MLNLVLCRPEIPQNTGNIARTCAVTGARLHLIHPLGFSLTDRYLRRAGLDYWDSLEVRDYPDLDVFLAEHGHRDLYLATTKAPRAYTDVTYPEDTWLLFGPESAGLPEDLLTSRPDRMVRIPMKPTERSLNLSNAVAVMAYEVLRQQGFPGLESRGFLGRAT